MRQQVEATIRINFDADAALSVPQLRDAIEAELLSRLVFPGPATEPVEAVEVFVDHIREEAEIYGNE